MIRSRGEQHWELLVIALGGLFCVGLGFWLAGETLNVMATGRSTGTTLFAAAGIGLRVLMHPFEPASGWPDATRPLMRAGMFWLVAALYIGLALYVLRRFGLRWEHVSRRLAHPKSARFAQSNDMRKLYMRRPEVGRITLGEVEGRRVASERAVSTLVLGPPGSMKTTSLITPIITQWQGPVLATSVKADVLNDTIAVRRQQGEVYIFDPAAALAGGVKTHTWSPLVGCKTWEGALKTAHSLVHSAKQTTGGSSSNEIWYVSAQQLLAPYLWATMLDDGDMEELLHRLDGEDIDAVKAALDTQMADKAQPAINALAGIQSLGPEQKSSVYFTARTVLEAYRQPSVLEQARTSEITPDVLLGGTSDTLYIVAPPHEQKALRSPFATLILSFVNAVYDWHVRTGEVLDPPMLLALDELANIAPIEELDEIASTARGVGIQLVSVFQDVGQIRHRWGESRAQTIVNNHLSKVILPGITDEHTLQWLARVTGDQELRQTSYTDGWRNRSVTDAMTFRPLLPANTVREQRKGHGILIYDNLPPIKLKLLPWFTDSKIKRLIEEAKANDPSRIDPTKALPQRPPEQKSTPDSGRVIFREGRLTCVRSPLNKRLYTREALAKAVVRVAADAEKTNPEEALKAMARVTPQEIFADLKRAGRKPSYFAQRNSHPEEHKALYEVDQERTVWPAAYTRVDQLWPQLTSTLTQLSDIYGPPPGDSDTTSPGDEQQEDDAAAGEPADETDPRATSETTGGKGARAGQRTAEERHPGALGGGADPEDGSGMRVPGPGA